VVVNALAAIREFVARIDAEAPEWARPYAFRGQTYAEARAILAEVDAAIVDEADASRRACAEALAGARVAQLIRQRDDLRERVEMLDSFNRALQEALVRAQGPLDLDSTDPVQASPPTGPGKGNGAAQ